MEMKMKRKISNFEMNIRISIGRYIDNKNREAFIEEIGACIYHDLGISGIIDRDIAEECFQIMRRH
jgi:hypothetical protein